LRARHALYVEPVLVDGSSVREVTLLRLSGTVDSSTSHVLGEVLTPHLKMAKHLVLDVSGVCLLASAGARVLVEWARRFAVQDRRLALVGPAPAVERSLRATSGIAVFRSFDAAVASLPRPSASGDAAPRTGGEVDALLRARRDLRAQIRTRPLIGQAMGMLVERYLLPDGDAAFALLRACSQRHNLKLRFLAAAVVAAPRPRSPGGMWFPGRVRHAVPATAFLHRRDVEPTNRSSVLDAVLGEAMRCTGVRRAHLQLVDPALDVLVLEKHSGLGEEFTDYFAHVGTHGTACAAARHSGERVTVLDVASDPIFAGRRSREVSLAAGSRSVQSTPVLNAAGRCVGVVSTHASQPGRRLSQGAERRVDVLVRETAEWLAWYQRTVVLDALEALHAMAGAQPAAAAAAAGSGAAR
jgi:anti-anti-sigma factor